jgi:hypothetical protein
VIAALSLRWRNVGRGTLADGSVSLFDVYQAKVVWDGAVRSVFVDEFDSTSLVGMALMRGCELKMQVRSRGKVTIRRLLGRKATELDTNKIDDAVLALLYLGLHDGTRVWKGFDWDAMNRLHEQGYITDPRGKAKSVALTPDGLQRAKRHLEELFSK